jgi:cytochrome c oxidase subunit III
MRPPEFRIVGDLSRLDTLAFGSRGIVWWGTLAFIAIESAGFVLAGVTYFYLRSRNDAWPIGHPPPDLLYGTLHLVLLVLSVWPNHWTKRAAENEDLRRIRIGLAVMVLLGLVLVAIRVAEFGHLNVEWSANAYGSIAWTLLGLHATHLVTDLADTIVLAVLMVTGPLQKRRFVDVSENAFYWDFVVIAWLPIYAVLYLVPRLP